MLYKCSGTCRTHVENIQLAVSRGKVLILELSSGQSSTENKALMSECNATFFVRVALT